MEKVLFKEEQRFTQVWRWVLLLMALLAVIFPMINAIAGDQEGLNSSGMSRMILYGSGAILFLLAVIIVMPFIRLKTRITYEGIYVAYVPFRRKWEKITKSDLYRYEVRKYRVHREFGGYGMKKRKKAGRAYTISGDIGLQLYFKDGKKLLIGTEKKQAIEYAMRKFMNRKE